MRKRFRIAARRRWRGRDRGSCWRGRHGWNAIPDFDVFLYNQTKAKPYFASMSFDSGNSWMGNQTISGGFSPGGAAKSGLVGA